MSGCSGSAPARRARSGRGRCRSPEDRRARRSPCRPASQLPVIRGTDAGLLLQAPQGLALWNPGSTPRPLPYSPSGGISDGFDATARLIAYGTGCTSRVTAPDAAHDPSAGYSTCQMLQTFDVVTGKLISFAAPRGTAGWVPNGFNLVSAISPAGQMIAAYAATGPQGQGRVRLYLMSVTRPSGQPRPVPSSAASLFARTAWSANGSWLLYQGPGGHLWAYQVTSRTTRASSTPCCQYTVMITAPSNPGSTSQVSREQRRGRPPGHERPPGQTWFLRSGHLTGGQRKPRSRSPRGRRCSGRAASRPRPSGRFSSRNTRRSARRRRPD